jgi:hypothetical protein
MPSFSMPRKIENFKKVADIQIPEQFFRLAT